MSSNIDKIGICIIKTLMRQSLTTAAIIKIIIMQNTSINANNNVVFNQTNQVASTFRSHVVAVHYQDCQIITQHQERLIKCYAIESSNIKESAAMQTRQITKGSNVNKRQQHCRSSIEKQ